MVSSHRRRGRISRQARARLVGAAAGLTAGVLSVGTAPAAGLAGAAPTPSQAVSDLAWDIWPRHLDSEREMAPPEGPGVCVRSYILIHGRVCVWWGPPSPEPVAHGLRERVR